MPENDLSSAEKLPAWTSKLYPDASNSNLHTRNHPNSPYQRVSITERKGAVDVRCELKDVVHGTFSKDGGEFASLIVVEFRFSPNGIARRIKEAHAVLTFAEVDPSDGRGSCPDEIEVFAVCPDGSFSVEPTQQNLTVSKGAGISLGGGVAGAQLSGEIMREHTAERTATDQARVRGSIDYGARTWGPRDSVSWTFLENETDKTGVVTSMQGVILLKRASETPFKCSFSLGIKADAKTRVGSTLNFRNRTPDDDIFFNPALPPTNRLQTYDADNLGSFELRTASSLVSQFVLTDTVRREASR